MLTGQLESFEREMTANDIDSARWAKILPNYLTGTAKSAYNTDIPADLAADYRQVKKILCAALGDAVQRTADL